MELNLGLPGLGRLSTNLNPTIRLPRLRPQKPTHSQHESLLPAAPLVATPRRSSNSSDCSNHFLIETRRNHDIDASIRVNIELKFRESSVNRTYVFPRVLNEPESPPGRISLQKQDRNVSLERIGRHAGSKSYDAGVEKGRLGKGMLGTLGTNLPLKEISFGGKQTRMRSNGRQNKRFTPQPALRHSHQIKPGERTKSPYQMTSVSPPRTSSRSGLLRIRISAGESKHRHERSLRGIRLNAGTPYGGESFSSTDRLNNLK